MKNSDLEKRLADHARIVKSAISAPFDFESEEMNMPIKQKKTK